MGDDLINQENDTTSKEWGLFEYGTIFLAGIVLIISYIGDQPSDFG